MRQLPAKEAVLRENARTGSSRPRKGTRVLPTSQRTYQARSIHYHQTHPWVIHNSNQRRLALGLEHYVEPVNDLQVFERDHWICQLCGEPVDRNLQWPDPQSPSLDHILPIVKGGLHKYANTQCAHLQCNLRKGVG